MGRRAGSFGAHLGEVRTPSPPFWPTPQLYRPRQPASCYTVKSRLWLEAPWLGHSQNAWRLLIASIDSGQPDCGNFWVTLTKTKPGLGLCMAESPFLCLG